MKKASKILTATDVGKNNSHLSALRVPMNLVDKGIMPALPIDTLNPKQNIIFMDENDVKWKFVLIYYNDKFFGKETRLAHNEYRLSNVREFLSAYNLDVGDEVFFSIDDLGIHRVSYLKKEAKKPESDDGIIHIRGGWKIYEF